MQTESRASSLLECYAEVQLNFCKVNANREQSHQACLRGYAEVQLSFCKVNKKYGQSHTPPPKVRAKNIEI